MSGNTSAPVTFAERYETVLVPVIFRRWAQEMIRRARPGNGEDILDLACGTGVVTREIVAAGARAGSLTGVDYSAEMLGQARAAAEALGIDADWIEADAGALPFADDSFDLAFCQQALQFFPDRAGALSELARVLRPGGRAAVCVQRDIALNPLLRAQAAALDKHVGTAAGDAVRAICGLPDGEEIRALFEDAGFRDVAVESVSLTLHHPDGRAFGEGAMGGMHTGDKLGRLDDAARDACVSDFLAGFGTCFDGAAITFPHVSNVVSARA